MNRYFSSLAEQSLSRTAESTLSILGITDSNLRQHLSDLMRADVGKESSFLAQPLFEQTFGWSKSELTMGQLAKQKLLSSEVVASLDRKENERYRFGKDWQPFTHQLESWKSLLQKKRSVVVTSGTGSGKTECFMVPILDDLFKEYRDSGSNPLVGVRALFLYPLNALINSQRERLNAWTQTFGSGIRYCLYNGNTEELQARVRTEQKIKPNEILSRELMREEPAPILVTNGTMLEYIMLRQADSPILQISRQQKSLRWIVLDEAHTYVGSQAAELALQLRRVMSSFGVLPEEVRFIATSATIADSDSADQLKGFLSDLSGVPKEQIDVLGGSRVVPGLVESDHKSVSLEELESMDALSNSNPEINPERYEALVHSPEARALRSSLVNSPKPLKVSELAASLSTLDDVNLSQDDILRWLDVCSGTKPSEGEEVFLKLRAHFFQRTTHGLWACFNRGCAAKRETPLEKNWPFGFVYVNHRQTCDCGSPVFELAFCKECNEPHLLARDKKGKLTQTVSSGGDDFFLQEEAPIEEDTLAPTKADAEGRSHIVLCAEANAQGDYVAIDLDKTSANCTIASGETVRLGLNDSDAVCSRSSCGYKGYQGALPFRRAMLGVPFYVANAVPTVLEYCQDFQDDDDCKGLGRQSLPGRGRRLITFTDSRQGTARMAVRMQQEAERNRLRGLVVEVLSWHQKAKNSQQDSVSEVAPEALRDLIDRAKEDVSLYKSLDMPNEVRAAEDKVRRLELQLSAKSGKKVMPILADLSWTELANELKQKSDLSGSMLLYNKYHKPEIFDANDGPMKLSEMLLFREFMRRPKRQNSLETQGIVRVVYKGIETIHSLPTKWEEKGLSREDWQDFLKVSLDFFVRESSFISMEESWRSWIGIRFSSKTLRQPESKELDENRVKRWPQIRNGNYSQRLIKLLLLGANLSPNKPSDVDLVNAWLKAAWLKLTGSGSVLKPDGNRFFLPREHMSFSLLGRAYICPVTNKILDTTFKGLTPYLPAHIDFSNLNREKSQRFHTESVDLPEVWNFVESQDDHAIALENIRRKVAEDQSVFDLRARNLWTDINDRTVEGGFYYRTAEHSAQQSSERLEYYEEKFKKGQINVLNCSTTMEMGVDIGGISAVVMNNVPPHPANYLQRAGRAGRSKESRALAYTLCKNNPHDQQVFSNPAWPFITKIPAPAVALNSPRLVQRHVNSWLLSYFLCNKIGTTQTERTKLNTHWFFSDEVAPSVCDQFTLWLGNAVSDADSVLKVLIKGTALSGIPEDRLRQDTIQQIKRLQERWLEIYKSLAAEELQAKPNSPYLKRLQVETTRHCKEYLLRDLAARTFLPGYGFPTDVVNFDNFTIEDYVREKGKKGEKSGDREDNVARYKGLPSRNLAVAIREYAPGSEVVLDGRVFRSAGVSLHWHNLNADSKEAQKFDTAWRCDVCGELGYEEGIVKTDHLVCTNMSCLSRIKLQNTRKVLRPAGFVTDAYESASNDIQHQKYIPVEPAWVFVKGERVPLPNPSVGYMTYGVDGEVFHHSSGEHQKGFALCLTCGRAESMLASGEFPSQLSPTHDHFPPRPGRDDKDKNNQRMPCSGRGSITPNVHLGIKATTDVFELTLRHPVRNEYITDSDDGRVVATTLVVALRSSLAGILGVATGELGYAIRPTRLKSGESVLAIQLYDVISGGAGFATSAPHYIEKLLRNMVEVLGCKHCETACSECLLDTQTRHDYDRLDRSRALEWLGDDFYPYVGLAGEEKLTFTDACYAPGTIENVVRRLVNGDADRVVFWAKGLVEDWDLHAPQFRRSILNYLLSDGISVDLVVPRGIESEDVLQDLYKLSLLGVNLCFSELTENDHVVAQVLTRERVTTIGSRSSKANVPGDYWLQSEGLVVTSKLFPEVNLEEMNFQESLVAKAQQTSVADVEINDEINGSVRDFGNRFWTYVVDEVPLVGTLLDSSRIVGLSYTDRYLQNPVSIVLLASILEKFKHLYAESADIEITTLFKRAYSGRGLAFEDWVDQGGYEDFTRQWIAKKLGVKVNLNVCASNREVPHHRKLIIKFANGRVLKVRFDQGMGYWQIRFQSHSDLKFDFKDGVGFQLANLDKALSRAKVQNFEQKWSTDVLVELQVPGR